MNETIKDDFAGVIDKIIGNKITKVTYSEVNDPNGKFYFDEFDVFDYSIVVEMENEFCWHLGWKDDNYMEFGEGRFCSREHLKEGDFKSWNATERW